MKAVNLIPAEERRTGGGLAGGLSGPTLGLLGALLVALVVVVAYVTVGNGVAEREDDLAAVEVNAAAAEARAAALKPYGDVAALKVRSAATVQQLAAMRVDWPALLMDLSRRMPDDVTLTELTGTVPDPATAIADVGAATATHPSVRLDGCTTDHTAVALAMERMRGMHGVSDVALGTSDTAKKGKNGDECGRADTFDITLTFAAAAPRSPVPAQALAAVPATAAEVAP